MDLLTELRNLARSTVLSNMRVGDALPVYCIPEDKVKEQLSFGQAVEIDALLREAEASEMAGRGGGEESVRWPLLYLILSPRQDLSSKLFAVFFFLECGF